jgi:CRISPR-associated endonuclease/helicase Cas3
MAIELAGGYTLSRSQNSSQRWLGKTRCAQQNTRRVFEDWRDDQGDVPFPLSDPLQMERFFQHHFFARKDEMDYPVGAQRDDTLLQMLGENGMAVTDAMREGVRRQGFMQSFASTAKQFRVIDSQTQGVMFPFHNEGKDLIAALSAAHDLAREVSIATKGPALRGQCISVGDGFFDSK